MVSLAQRAAFAADTLTEEDVKGYARLVQPHQKQQKDIIPHKNCEKLRNFSSKTLKTVETYALRMVY